MAHLVARAASDGKPCGSIAVAGAGDLSPSGIDRSATATIAFANGVRARVACAINADLESTVTIRGDEGWIEVRSPWLPGWIPGPAVIAVEREGAHQDIEVVADRDPYVIEVEAVAELIHEGTLDPPAMPAVESLANMRTLDRWRDVIGVVYDADEERHAATSRVIEGPV
jgi:predicted dehydrogenase